MMIHSVAVSAIGHRCSSGTAASAPLWSVTVTLTSLMADSIAVRLTSPSPCRTCESPVKISAPGRHTGMKSLVPSFK